MINFDIIISNHAVERFSQRFPQKERVRNNASRKYFIAKIYEILEQMYKDDDSYVEVIENIENFKKKHEKFAEKRKQENSSVKYVHKDTQLVFVFTQDFKVLISIRIDTGKFKKRRTQHKIIFTLKKEKENEIDKHEV